MPPRRPRARTPWRRFRLGSGPLKRTSDRVEFLSRIVLVLALCAAAPAGALAGTAVTTGTRAVAAAEAAARHPVSATLLADVPDGGQLPAVPAPAVWPGPDGGGRTGRVDAPAGARAGSSVVIWVDAAGRPADPPVSDAEAAAQGVVIGVLTLVGVVLAVVLGHLAVVRELARRRARRWERGWAAVEPLWVSRFR